MKMLFTFIHILSTWIEPDFVDEFHVEGFYAACRRIESLRLICADFLFQYV